jgi:hypothetical protein
MGTSAPAGTLTKNFKAGVQELQEFRSKPQAALLPDSATPELLLYQSLTSSQFFTK